MRGGQKARREKRHSQCRKSSGKDDHRRLRQEETGELPSVGSKGPTNCELLAPGLEPHEEKVYDVGACHQQQHCNRGLQEQQRRP
jgi:hypothetical protein